MALFKRKERKKRIGTRTTTDAQVYLTVSNAMYGNPGLTVRVLTDERSVNEARYDAEERRHSSFFVVHKIDVETIRPWYHDDDLE